MGKYNHKNANTYKLQVAQYYQENKNVTYLNFNFDPTCVSCSREVLFQFLALLQCLYLRFDVR